MKARWVVDKLEAGRSGKKKKLPAVGNQLEESRVAMRIAFWSGIILILPSFSSVLIRSTGVWF